MYILMLNEMMLIIKELMSVISVSMYGR